MRKNKSFPNAAFTLHRHLPDGRNSHWGNYGKLHIGLLFDYTQTFRSAEIKFSWQSNHDEPHRWYGGRVEVEAKSLDDLKDVEKLLRWLFGPQRVNDRYNWNFGCTDVLAKLAKLPQVVYDCRLSEYVPIDDVKPDTYSAWRDDWKAVNYNDGSTGCTVGCIARRDEDAREKLTRKFADLDFFKNRIERWFAAGRPVIRLSDPAPIWIDRGTVLAQAEEAEAETAIARKAAITIVPESQIESAA